jgi:hypothetical protein
MVGGIENEGEAMPPKAQESPTRPEGQSGHRGHQGPQDNRPDRADVRVHLTQVGGWKKQALAGLPDVFGNGREQMRQQADAEKGRTLQADGPTQSGVGLSQKKSWPYHLTNADDGSIHSIPT